MQIKLGLFAISFGFGPISKALSVAKAIDKCLNVEWHFLEKELA